VHKYTHRSNHRIKTMNLTADQLLQIAGIAPTNTLRTRLNESVSGAELDLTTLKSGDRIRITHNGKVTDEFVFGGRQFNGAGPGGPIGLALNDASSDLIRSVSARNDGKAIYAARGWGVELVQKAIGQRGSVKESDEGDAITSVTYTYLPRLENARADAHHPDGSTSLVSEEQEFEHALDSGEISAKHMSRIDYDKIQDVLFFMMGVAEREQEDGEYDGVEDVVFDETREEHNRLFGTGVTANFEVGYDS
jgi:hypothetical protein